MVGLVKLCLESNPITSRDTQRAQTNLVLIRPRDPTETEPELCLSVSYGGMGQQWTAAGLGTLSVPVPAWNSLKEVTIIFITSTEVWPPVK